MNWYMRCIEIMGITEVKRRKVTLELIHEMYWNASEIANKIKGENSLNWYMRCIEIREDRKRNTTYKTWTDTWDVLKLVSPTSLEAPLMAWTDTWDVLKCFYQKKNKKS